MNYKAILLILLFLSTAKLFSQSNIQDSILIDAYLGKARAHFSKTDSLLFYLPKAFSLLKKYEKYESYTTWLNSFSVHYYNKHKYEDFKERSEFALEECRRYLDENHSNTGDAFLNLGLYNRIAGRNEKSIFHYKEALKIQSQNNTSVDKVLVLFQNMNAAYRAMGDFDQGIQILNQALLVHKDSFNKENESLARIYLDLGHLYRDKKELDEAKKYYDKSSEIYSKYIHKKPKIKNHLIYCHQSLSKIHLVNENIDSSFFHVKKAIELEGGEYKFRKITSYEALGDIYLFQNEIGAARAAYDKSNLAAIEFHTSFNKHKSIARTFSNIAYSYLKGKDYESALTNYQSALIALALDFDDENYESNPPINTMLSKTLALRIIKEKGKVFLKKYEQQAKLEDLKLAFHNYEFAIDIIQELRNSFEATASKNELAEQSLEIYEGAIQTAYLLFKKTGDQKYKELAFQYGEQNKARLLEEILQEDYARIAGGLPLEELQKGQKIRQRCNYFQNKINIEKSKLSKKDETEIKFWTSSFFDINNEYNELTSRFEKEYPEYYALKYAAKNVDIEKIRKNILNQENALLEYFVGKERIYLFCLTKNDLEVLELDKSPNFAEDISTLQKIISQSPFESKDAIVENRMKFADLSYQIYNSYLQPAISYLPKEIKHLIIIPDDVLAFIPFDILLTKEVKGTSKDYSLNTFEYLIKQFTSSTNYSASLLVNHSTPKINNDLIPFLGFAPTFGKRIADNRSCTSDEVYTLQCNFKEVEAIHNIFGGQMKDGINASSNVFKEQAAQSRILHLATHACVNEENPDLNKIYFADDYLTGTDLNNLKLNAELAVLSACNTGSGKLIKGEGVMSLSRSFILAGCPSTLTSLWSVDDCTTSEIMIRYYENLKEGLSKDAALRKAKLDHLSTADKVSSHPYFWAAFVQSGNIDPMVFENPRSNYLWLLLIPIAVFGFFFLKSRKTS